MELKGNNKGLFERYDVFLMLISLVIIALVVVSFALYPEQGNAMANKIMHMLTHTLGSPIQLVTVSLLLFFLFICFSKYGDIRLGKNAPDFKLISWVAMMFFCGQGAGTVYWAFSEWAYHFNAHPQLNGVEYSEAFRYEIALAYTFFDWGPLSWSTLCMFALPFAYHYHVKQGKELRFSALCRYSLGEKHARGLTGRIMDFLLIFSAVGSIAISAGTSASTIAHIVGALLGIPVTFALSVIILLGVAVMYTITSLLGIEKGMRRISDWNVYFCAAMILYICVLGPGQFILDSLVNSLGVMLSGFVRMIMWTDPVASSGYPQDWTVFYAVYGIVFGPFTGLFVAKISKGRKLKEIIINMVITGSAGMWCFFAAISAYQQKLRIDGILDVPNMLATGQAQQVGWATLETMPFTAFISILYLIVIILFLATTLDATAFTLSSTIAKDLKGDEEPGRGLKFIWCVVLVALPLALTFAGTDIGAIKAVVLATGVPLLVGLAISYHGFIREMLRDYKQFNRQEILDFGNPDLPEKVLDTKWEDPRITAALKATAETGTTP